MAGAANLAGLFFVRDIVKRCVARIIAAAQKMRRDRTYSCQSVRKKEKRGEKSSKDKVRV